MKKLLSFASCSALIFYLTISAVHAMNFDSLCDEYNFDSEYREFVPPKSTGESSLSSTNFILTDQPSLEMTQDEMASFRQNIVNPIEENSLLEN